VCCGMASARNAVEAMSARLPEIMLMMLT